jgi:hypothetical protein
MADRQAQLKAAQKVYIDGIGEQVMESVVRLAT